MVLKLDSRYPVLWRDPSTLQVGLAPAVVRIDDISLTEERMLAALVTGVSAPGLTMLADGDAAARDAFLERLAPALERRSPIAPPSLVAVCGSGPTVDAVARALGGHGIHSVVSGDPAALLDQGADLAIAVGHFVLMPQLHAVWLRRDVPHVPVVFDDSGVVVGPLVVPGRSTCLRCLELHRRDADPAWTALASQLLGRTAGTESTLLATEAAALAVRLALAWLEDRHDPGSVRIDAASGERERREHAPHAECGCLEVPTPLPPISAARRGTGSARVASLESVRRSRPTTGAATVARA